jgi:hypothetical protein
LASGCSDPCNVQGHAHANAWAANVPASDSLAISAAETSVETVPIKTVILGQAYIKRGEMTGKPDRFVCLIGEKGKVLLTFFTSK